MQWLNTKNISLKCNNSKLSLLQILIEEGQLTYPSLSIRICSHNLPLGSGLGSSAAYSVSLASAFLLYAQQLQLEDEIG